MPQDHVIQKLNELRGRVPNIKAQGAGFQNTAEFSNWKDTTMKWLKLGQPHTHDELQKFAKLFATLRAKIPMYGQSRGHVYNEQSEYERACDQAVHLIDSAIENLENDLVPDQLQSPQSSSRRGGESSKYSTTIAKAGTVVLGDRNIVSVVDSITISDFLDIIDKEIETKTTDPDQKQSLRQKLVDISKNPTLAQIVGQTLGQVLRAAFGH